MNEVLLKNGSVLRIRRSHPDDAEEILGYLKTVGSESDNLLFGAEGMPFTVEQEREFLAKTAEAKTSIMLTGLVDGRIVSVVNLNSPSRERIAHTADIGVSVLKAYWNAGVGTAMVGALIDFARSTGVIEIVHLEVRADNVHAIQLYEKVGFVPIGRYPRRIRIGGDYFDTLLMNLRI
jgi:RimJ/RimL family protein N-acetyltransferase